MAPLPSILLSITTLLRYVVPSVEKDEISRLDSELRKKLNPLHSKISTCSDPKSLSMLGNQLSLEILEFMKSNHNLFNDMKPQKEPFIQHNSQSLKQLNERKKILRKKAFSQGSTVTDRRNFHDCLKAISEFKKILKKREQSKTTLHQEKMYFKNKWNFAKLAVAGTLFTEKQEVGFSREEANNYYPNTYSRPAHFDPTNLNWFPEISTGNYKEFNMDSFRPGDVKKILKSANQKSSPGPDGITYSILYKFSCLHHILATLFNKILSTGGAPPAWSESVVKLLHKKGPAGNPQNFRMIALTSCIGKTYHLLLAKRFTDYLTSNNFIDSSLQKAFLPGINGCYEHNIVMDEIIKTARSKKKTAHITFFDLEDAFGSVPHPLILHSLRRFKFPAEIQYYINTLYSNQLTKVFTKTFTTDAFPFKRGVFQGDPLSPIIFLMVFNPIIEFLQSEIKHGFTSINSQTITLPYADDFCLITNNVRTHQRLMDEINSKILSMGMKLKPAKCRTFSIKSGSASDSTFFIGKDKIPTIFLEEQKFLGKLIFPFGKSSETFEYIHNILSTKLQNLEKISNRNEHKLWIYKNYLIPSIRFLLTVHDLPKQNLRKLDTFTDKFLKKWCGLPPSATNAILHMKTGMDIPSITEIYTLSHCLAHLRTRRLGDAKVNLSLDSKLQRESQWTRKESITCYAENQYIKAANQTSQASSRGKRRKMVIPCKEPS